MLAVGGALIKHRGGRNVLESVVNFCLNSKGLGTNLYGTFPLE